MELDKFARQLRLMELLTHNYQYSIEEVSEKLKMSKRSIIVTSMLSNQWGSWCANREANTA